MARILKAVVSQFEPHSRQWPFVLRGTFGSTWNIVNVRRAQGLRSFLLCRRGFVDGRLNSSFQIASVR
jgi:hypothetical protein